MGIKLSICIPTYNRKKNLSELLDALAELIGGAQDIEVIISDNASTDGTNKYMEDLEKKGKFRNLRYHRNYENVGPDNNFVMCYKLAKGDYIWLLGDDDIITGDIVPYLMEVIKKYSPGVVYITFSSVTENMGEKSEISIDDWAVVCDDYVDFMLKVDYLFLISAFICKREIIASIDFSKYVQCKELKYVLAILKCAFESVTNVVVAGKNYLKVRMSINTWDRYETIREWVLVNSIRYEEEEELYYWFVRKIIYQHALSTFFALSVLFCRENVPETSLRWKKTIALDTLEIYYPILKAGYEWLVECPIEKIGASQAVEIFQEIKKESIIDFAKKLKSIYIYGAGYWGKYYKQLLEDYGVNINGFLVSDYEEITGENIYHLSEVLPTEPAGGVLVAVQYGRKMFDILKSLLASEWKNRMDHIVFID